MAPELTLRSAVELFVDRHIGGAPVMAGSRLVGVISTIDILALESSMPSVSVAAPDQVELPSGTRWRSIRWPSR